MAIKTQQLTVTTTRQQLVITDTDDTAGVQVWLYGEFHGSSGKVAFGGEDVTIANGLHIYGDEKFGPITLEPDDKLYFVSTELAGLDIRVLIRGA